MMHIITAALARNNHAQTLWPQIRARAGMDIFWNIMIDGNKDTPWHQVEQNYETAKLYADRVGKTPYHVGNGKSVQRMQIAIPRNEPFIILDADVLPSQDFAKNLVEFCDSEPRCGVASGWPSKKQIQPNVYILTSRERLNNRIALHTVKGRAAIRNYDTDVPIGGFDNLSLRVENRGLFRAYIPTVWVEEHPSDDDDPKSPYNLWRLPYLK